MTESAIIGLRWFQYAGAVTLLGAPLFLLTSFRREEGSVPPAFGRMLLVATVTVSLASAFALVAQTAMMAGSWSEALKPASLSFVVTGTGLGAALMIRAVIAALAAVIVCLIPPGRIVWTLLVGLGLIVAASFAWTGHGASTEGAGRAIHIGVDIVHAIAAALWLGALAVLTVILSRPGLLEAGRSHLALHRFSALGTVSVALLFLTGLANSGFLIGADRILMLGSSLWGQLLIAKLILFVVMCGLAALNRFRLTPALGMAIEGHDDPSPALGRLRRSVAVETLAGALLLVLVAVMGVQMPPNAM